MIHQRTKKCQDILNAACDLFYKFGIRRVSIEEICRIAKVSKMTFYKHFKNKDDIALNILNDIFQESVTRYNQVMESDKAFPDKIREVIVLKREYAQKVSPEFIADFYNNENPEFRKFISQHTQSTIARFIADIKQAQDDGWVRKDTKPEFILYFIELVQEKILDPKLLALYGNQTDLIMDFTNFFFYGILEPQTKA